VWEESAPPRPYDPCMPHNLDDTTRRARAGGPEAIDAFVHAHWPTVWRAAYAITVDAQLAEDAAQETFLRALRALDRLDRRPVEPWLRRIAANTAIDQLRRRPRGWVPAELAPEPAGADPAAGDDNLMAAVLGLPYERRVVVVLHFWLDFSHREIARALAIPMGTVASRLNRALADLALRLTEVSSGTAR
jgi:RNA polymerase sigma-70 factor, ECF subfamily